MTRLSVNVNKLATLRNARGKNNPDLLKTTLDIIDYGAQGITLHPRPDGRHIRQSDVYAISKAIDVELNIEGFPDENYLALVTVLKPTQCTLVPDPPQALTSNAGWKLEKNCIFLTNIITKLQNLGIRTSLFIDPFQLTTQEFEALVKTGTDRVELYTEAYADAFATDAFHEVLSVYKQAADQIHRLGIELNAGHDLNQENLRAFIKSIPCIQEVSIGHALICDALYFGLRDTVARYLDCLRA